MMKEEDQEEQEDDDDDDYCYYNVWPDGERRRCGRDRSFSCGRRQCGNGERASRDPGGSGGRQSRVSIARRRKGDVRQRHGARLVQGSMRWLQAAG